MKRMIAWLALAGCSCAQAGEWSQTQLARFTDSAELNFAVVSNFNEQGKQMQLTLDNQSELSLPASGWAVYFHSVRQIAPLADQPVQIEHVQGDLHRLVPAENFAGLAAGAELSVTYQPSAHMVSYTDFMPRAFMVFDGLEAEVFANTDTEDMTAFVAPIVKPEQQLRSQADNFTIATAQNRYERNSQLPAIDSDSVATRIIPAPTQMDEHRGEAQLTAKWQLRYAGSLKAEAEYLNSRLQQMYGFSLTLQPDHIPADGPTIYLRATGQGEKKLPVPETAESYILKIDDDTIVIDGRDAAGAFYGVQSLLALSHKSDDQVKVKNASISDSPRAVWRGMHYDMGRNFHGQEVTLRLIEQMGRYKLNKLHMHVTEDEGWRLEIPGLPELTEVGATRCFDLEETECLLTQLGTGPHTTGSGNGYYSKADFIELLRFAAARHIEVIPEIDMPGHARAAVKAMDARYTKLMQAGDEAAAKQYLLADPDDASEYLTVQNYTDNSINVCLESTYRFVDKVIYELQQMYREAGLKLSTFHMGGDEVGKGSWSASPVCDELFARELGVAGPADLKPYFVSRVSQLASERGLDLAGWEDGLMYDPTNTFNRKQFVNERVIANAWDNIWEWGVADRAYRLANNGYQVVLSHATHLYFDHPHEAHPAERGYYWAARYTDMAKVFNYLPDDMYANADFTRNGDAIENLEALVGRPLPTLQKPENILGIQGQVWTETIRTADQLEQMIYPRMLVMAERAWHKAGWESNGSERERSADYQAFSSALFGREIPRLQAQGAELYIPPPGARIEDGELTMNSAYPTAALEYSLDGAQWQTYRQPVNLGSQGALVRTKLGESVSRVERVEAQ
ncbi:family 20 glycosylhydrolase [Gilvimarinus sp. DA14]|uniref:family 20 glycosylhydrolase n=1 Tax=Gilvimarinus sp. DA14 TaxID=2956798 RepID=UPI0020B72478|nr:family 20 glycosylhydrolase [Gilvimarinus sp. DA14]UTF59863.1 carbohydate-binding domain-containing protein [Gilvimarinus sp. DA14]